MTEMLKRSKWPLTLLLAIGVVFLAGSIRYSPSGISVEPGINQALAKAGCPDGDAE